MILRFRNLGIIEKADINISKPFIVFTGPNGTGKTYLSYVLSELPNSFGGFFMALARKEEEKEKLKSIFDPSLLKNDSILEGALDPDALYDLFQRAVKAISKSLLTVLNLKDENNGFKIEILSSKEAWRKELLDMKLDCGYFLHLEKKPGTYSFTATDLKDARERMDNARDDVFEFALFMNSVFMSGSSATTMFTAERSGITLFSKEISVGRLKDSNPRVPRYPRPISLALADAEDRAYHRKHMSLYADLADEIENYIIKGQIEVSSEGELLLNEDGNKLDLALSSSSIKALAELVFYIRHRALKMSKLIVDEPELNLHPDNQLIISRVFAKMVNRGLSLIVSTHSDYIIRELNNLIMLSGLPDGSDEKLSQWGYSTDMELHFDRVAAYLFSYNSRGKVEVKPVLVTETGFKASTIDETISRQNEISQAIYYELRYGKERKIKSSIDA